MTEPLTTQALPELPVPNLPLLRKVLDHIDAHPEEWDQKWWVSPCGTKACIAGTALIMSGRKLARVPDSSYSPVHGAPVVDDDPTLSVPLEAQRELGLTDRERVALFDGFNFREDVQRIAEEIAARAGERL